MDAHAGQVFICGCCRDEFDESLARFDNDLKAPVCAGCDRQLKWSLAYLKVAKIHPVIEEFHYRNRIKS